jgi:phosphohistidine swiveling domain-containing protein
MFPIVPASQDPALVGAKAANLARLAEFGESAIPPYFVVATPVFDAVMSSQAPAIGALEAEPPDSEALPRLAQALQDRILAADLPVGLVATIASSYQAFSQQLGVAAARVSVRSSATAEDGRSASFAGQYTTCLDVQGTAALVRAIRRVWASTWSVQALRYRKPHWASQAPVRMAVIVQQMVAAASAGTVYTLDPETGVPLTCINAVPGLGVAEVSGESTPTSWLIDPRTLTIIRRRSAPGSVGPLAPATLLDLVRQVDRIRAHFQANWETPILELEFACARDGQVFFTQVRPETVWSQGKAHLTAVDLDQAAHLTRLFQGGMTGCPGVAAGVLRVVRSLAEAQTVARVGDILVTPNTANVWEHLFGRIGGIVTEVGGTGSHTAVVMRELGKPALVGAGGAMQALAVAANQPVTLDATQRLVFAGAQAAGMTHRLRTVLPIYGGADEQTEDAAWAEASSQPGRTVTDRAGQRWIYKPEYPVCRFMQSVLLDAHRWVAQRLGVPVRNDIQGNVHRIAFADVMQWRHRLKGLSLDDLERLEAERETVMSDYLAACEGFALEPEAVQHWLGLYVRMNAFIGVGFPIYKVTEGLLEQALAQQRIVEPYYTQIRLARNGLGGLESNRAADGLRALVAEALGDNRLAVAVATACAQQTDRPLKASACAHFYQRIAHHARSYKVTSVAEIDLPLRSAVLAVAQAIRSSLGGGLAALGASGRFLPDEDVTFFPNDDALRRVHRLALAAEKARQDSHHLRVRGHWWIRDDLERLADYLIGAGRIGRFAELFDHPPDWLLQQVDDFWPGTASIPGAPGADPGNNVDAPATQVRKRDVQRNAH